MVIRCEIAPKALYFPSKLHKMIISKALNLSIITYDTFLESLELINYHYCQIIVTFNDLDPYFFSLIMEKIFLTIIWGLDWAQLFKIMPEKGSLTPKI